MNTCPGRYCGRKLENINSTGVEGCGACPRGFRADNDDICLACESHPLLYDYLYLGFMAILPLLLNCFFIEFSAQRKATLKLLTLEHSSALFECVSAAIVTLLLTDPKGTIWIRTCGVSELSDWYTYFYNPSIDYITQLRCTQEAVYPLYSMPFYYYCFCLLLLLVVRSTFFAFPAKISRHIGLSGSMYAALYFYPLLIIVHAVFAGVLYYSFPYILLVACLIANAFHLSVYEEQTFKGLISQAAKKPQNIVVLTVFSLLYMYCIISITRLSDMITDLCLLLLVPAPTLFYMLTVFATDPGNLSKVP